MPFPRKGEDKKAYISRFMGAAEAVSDFPDEKQRYAVAQSMFERERQNATFQDPFGSPKQHPWPKKFSCSFIEPGVVFYQDLGEDGETILVKQEALAKMAASFVGKPVIDKVHKDVTPETIADGEADGIVTRVWLDEKSGWWMCDFLVWNPEAQGHCESTAYSVSCAYEPTDVDSSGGSYHNLPYQEEVKDGEYTHLALVTNPRYEGARIFVNSKGGKGGLMSWRFWEKGSRKNASNLDPLKTMVDVDGKQVPLQNLYDAHKEGEAKAAEPVLNDDTVLEVDGKEKKLSELKDSYRAKLKASADAAPAPEAKKEDAPAPEAAKKDEAPLPDPRANAADEEAKKAEELKKSEDLKNAADEEAKKAEDAALLEKKNADDKKAADEAALLEKKNADDKKAADDAAALEKKNAEDAEAKKLEEKRNAGKAAFAALKNAASERTGDPVKINVTGLDERLARGAKKYGSAA